MKQFFVAILLSALLVLSVPAGILAAPAQTVNGEMFVYAVDRQLNVRFHDGIGTVAGTVVYNGILTSATGGAWASLVGAGLTATEHVNYRIDPFGNIIPGKGKVQGTATITGGAGIVTFKYKADVWGNVFVGPAGDNGDWQVTKTDGPYKTLKESEGTWTAAVQLTEIAPNVWTFAGKVSFTGTY